MMLEEPGPKFISFIRIADDCNDVELKLPDGYFVSADKKGLYIYRQIDVDGVTYMERIKEYVGKVNLYNVFEEAREHALLNTPVSSKYLQ